jgi:DNA-binding transcriptional regulator/RsmH inhibitor MraZ
MPSTHPSKLRFQDRVNYFGQSAELDSQGRVLIPVRLRDAATMSGDVDVLGQFNYLDVWNHERFLTRLQRDHYTDDDARALAEFGI